MAVPGHKLDRMFNPEVVAVVGDKGPGYMLSLIHISEPTRPY